MILETESQNLRSAALLVLIVLLWVFYLWAKGPSGIPPFPVTPLPIVGNLLSLERDPRKQFARWRKEHGDIFSLYLGRRLVIVLNGYDTLRHAFVNNADMFSGRPDIFVFTHALRGHGIIASSGPVWKSQRTLALHVLRELGFGKKVLEEKILEEVERIVNFVNKNQGEKEDYAYIYLASTSNTICNLIFGQRFDYDDPVFVKSLHAVNNMFESLVTTGAANFLPFLQYVPGDPASVRSVLNNVDCYENLVKYQIEQHLQNSDGRKDDFISGYIREMKKWEDAGEDTKDLRDNLTQTVCDLFLGGTETTATTLSWLVLFLIYNPEVQQKCFQEIKENVGLNCLPTLNDKPFLPYTEATLAETQRLGSIAPFAAFHNTAEDIRFQDFNFPKGVVVMPNLDSVLMDPEVWPNPDEFHPERFLDKEGKFYQPKEFVPFLMGRRVCLGQAMAKMQLFLVGSALIQKFNFQQPEDEPCPSLIPKLGSTSKPAPYRVRAVPRY